MRGSRDKRRKSSKLNNDETNPRSDGFQDAMPGKGSYVEDSVVVKGDPVTSSTPKESKRNAEDQPKSESRRNPRRLQASSSFIVSTAYQFFHPLLFSVAQAVARKASYKNYGKDRILKAHLYGI